MKTLNYNPSIFEINLAKAISACKDEIQQNLKDMKIVETSEEMQRDNPLLIFQLEDQDGDRHEVVIKVIQRPDQH
jgi:hypothetical protein